MAKTDYKTIDEYISTHPEEVQVKLEQIRETIHKAAPEAKEVISYQMPTFRQNGILVHFAAFTSHISFFPPPLLLWYSKTNYNRTKHPRGPSNFRWMSRFRSS